MWAASVASLQNLTEELIMSVRTRTAGALLATIVAGAVTVPWP